jgi:hypothetical protein
MSNREDAALVGYFFTSRIERVFLRSYRKFFSIAEIEDEPILQIASGGLLLALLYGLSSWINSGALTIQGYQSGAFSCWPYFQECGTWHVLTSLPYGYSQTIFGSAIFALMLGVAYAMYRKDWTAVHMGLLVLWTMKVLITLVLTRSLSGNYEYYDIVLLFVLLWLPNKFLFMRLVFVLLYFLASTIKIDAGWILGTYFTSLNTGLPIFGDTFAPVITNIVIFMQIVGAWFLLSKHTLLRRSAFTYFVLFHLYSIILVHYRYPVSALVMLIILFGIAGYRALPTRWFTKQNTAGLLLLTTLLCIQLFPILIIEGSQKFTLEGNMYGLYMFEANHQCRSSTVAHLDDGTSVSGERESENARNRCDPYSYWFLLKQLCLRDPDISRIEWTFDHSINGGPFYRIVDTQDVCELDYEPFSHNEWIRTEKDTPPVVGYPVKNIYY